MSESIYDKALEELKDLEIILYYDVSKIKMALKQAKKQDKILKLYQKYYKEYDDLTLNEATTIINKIKELENDI